MMIWSDLAERLDRSFFCVLSRGVGERLLY